MDWKDDNVLVTGATGFLGTWLTKALIERGANVIALVRDEVPNAPIRTMGIYPKIHSIVRGDITNYDDVKRVFSDYAIDTCFHVAAQVIVGSAKQDPTTTFNVNIKGTWNVLEAARAWNNCKRIIVASTDKVYGQTKVPKEGLHEGLPLNALFPYDASKVAVDVLSRTYSQTYNLPIGVTRCCNIYGGGDLNFTRIIPGAIKSILMNQNPIIRSDGTPIRDFIHVDDAVSAYITLAEKIDKIDRNEPYGEAFNFGSNEKINMLDLTNKIIQVSGRKHLKPDVQGKAKPGFEIDEQWISAKKAKTKLGWEPKVKLEEGLKKTISWYEDYFSKIGKY